MRIYFLTLPLFLLALSAQARDLTETYPDSEGVSRVAEQSRYWGLLGQLENVDVANELGGYYTAGLTSIYEVMSAGQLEGYIESTELRGPNGENTVALVRFTVEGRRLRGIEVR